MTVHDARELLGVSADASRAETRRAYLRAIKSAKPDVDPDGFKRIREAYDLLSSAVAVSRREPPVPVEAAIPFETPPEPFVVPLPIVPMEDARSAHDMMMRALQSIAAATDDPAIARLSECCDVVVAHGSSAHERFVATAARELMNLPADVPRIFVQTMARGLTGSGLTPATDRLAELRREQPDSARDLVDHLYWETPALAKLFGSALQREPPKDVDPIVIPFAVAILAGIVLFAFRNCLVPP